MTLLPGATLVEANPGWSCEKIKTQERGIAYTASSKRGLLLQASNKEPPDLLIKKEKEKNVQIRFH